MKSNWKKKYEETAGLLKLARDGNAVLREQLNGIQMMNVAPRVIEVPAEKIVEKEVLPWWVLFVLFMLIFSFVSLCGWVALKADRLQIPIKEPYPVSITKYIPPDPYALDVCKDAWRADERELRKLRKIREP